MGTINATGASLPAAQAAAATTPDMPQAAQQPGFAAATTAGATATGFSNDAVQTLSAAGIPASAIAVASTAVANARANASTGTTGPAPSAPGTGTGTTSASPAGSLPGLPAGSSAGATAGGASSNTAPASGQMDATYPSLVGRQVWVLRALGFPEANIQQLAAANPSALDVAKQIVGWAQSPSTVDNYLALAPGTTAQRMQALPQDVLADAAGMAGQAQSPAPTDGTGAAPKDSTYTMLDADIVQLFQAMKTPADRIQQINDGRPTEQQVLDYIKSSILQDPEAWDASNGNPAGTARAALVAAGLTPAPVGQGNPSLPSSNTSPQIGDIPGVNSSTPVSGPAAATDGTNGLIKEIVWGVAALGVGFLAWKFLKGRSAKGATEAVKDAATGVETLGKAAPKFWQKGGMAFGRAAKVAGTADAASVAAAAGIRPGIELYRMTPSGMEIIPDAMVAFGLKPQEILDSAAKFETIRRMDGVQAIQNALQIAAKAR